MKLWIVTHTRDYVGSPELSVWPRAFQSLESAICAIRKEAGEQYGASEYSEEQDETSYELEYEDDKWEAHAVELG